MTCLSPINVTNSNLGPGKKKSPAKSKCSLQISKELHTLILQMSKDMNLSLEQVVAKAVIKSAKAALDTPDSNKQRLYFSLAKHAERELRQRYIGEHSRRSAQMRHINDLRRRKSATQPSISPYFAY